MKYAEWSNEEDRWITENARKYRSKPNEMLKAMNEVFGNDRTFYALRQRKFMLCVKETLFTPEQEEWLKGHFYLPRKTLQKVFNETFGECRGVNSLQQKMVRLQALRNKPRKKEE